MTIRVEREALLRVISRKPSGPTLSCKEEEFVFVDLPSKPYFNDALVPRATAICSDDDTCSLSDASDTLSSDSSIHQRRVSFAPSLVSDEWTRPFTPKCEIRNLFYSNDETNSFRQEYRLERKVLSELSLDPDAFPVDNEGLSNLIATNSCQQNSRHSISRVVVLHNDRLETFMGPEEQKRKPSELSNDFFDNDSFWSGSLTWY